MQCIMCPAFRPRVLNPTLVQQGCMRCQHTSQQKTLVLLGHTSCHGTCGARLHQHTPSQCSTCMHHHASASTTASTGSSTSRSKLALGPAPAGMLAPLVLVRKG